MARFIILSEKPWHSGLANALKKHLPAHEWLLINEIDDFTQEKLDDLGASKIFIPHWSHLIPAGIFKKHECLVFHMTDLPYGRGGSPLQNLIVRGHTETKISALKVDEGIDTGPVYLKKDLSLDGTAQDIFELATVVIQEMIIEIVKRELKPSPQLGEATVFKRRTREDGNLQKLENIEQLYDYIRMLDAEGYPPAYIELEHVTLEFSKADLNSDNTLSAHVRITKK